MAPKVSLGWSLKIVILQTNSKTYPRQLVTRRRFEKRNVRVKTLCHAINIKNRKGSKAKRKRFSKIKKNTFFVGTP